LRVNEIAPTHERGMSVKGRAGSCMLSIFKRDKNRAYDCGDILAT
jgi:hypothetical protein